MQDLIAGRIDYQCAGVAVAIPQIDSKRVKAIAILGNSRSPGLPAVATAHEQGLADFDVGTWSAYFFPKRTPGAIIRKLNNAVVATLEMPSVQERLAQIGNTVVSPERQSPEYLQKFVESEIARWGTVIKAAGVSAD
jgi:tripartite-type tricarboxylate transporter receptor subunit TctC